MAKRYETGSKLNVKKIIAVIVFILVIVMFIIGIKNLLANHSENASGRVETVTYYTAYDNGKWGVINSYGELIVKASYDDMIVIPDSTKAVFICAYDVNYAEGTYKTKAINAKGKDIIQGYETIEAITNIDKNKNSYYESNVLKVKKDGKYGLCDFSGKEILASEYESIEPIQGIKNSLLIKKDGKYGLCENTGNVIIEPKYNKIEKIENNNKNGYIVVNEENKYGIIGVDKTVVLECKYEEIKPIASNELFAVKNSNKYKIINKSGEKVLNDEFDDIQGINGENIIAVKNGKAGVVNKSGDTKIKFNYEEIKAAGANYIAKKNDKFGVIDENGNEKIAFNSIEITYVNAGDFLVADYLENNNLVSKVINTQFEPKITGTVIEINDEKGYLIVFSEENYKYYNFKFEEKEASNILTNNTLFLSKRDGKYGFIDKEGKVIVDYIYDDATEQNSSGYAGIKKDGVWGSIDSKGKVVVEPEYNLDENAKIDFIGAWHLCEDENANYYLDV